MATPLACQRSLWTAPCPSVTVIKVVLLTFELENYELVRLNSILQKNVSFVVQFPIRPSKRKSIPVTLNFGRRWSKLAHPTKMGFAIGLHIFSNAFSVTRTIYYLWFLVRELSLYLEFFTTYSFTENLKIEVLKRFLPENNFSSQLQCIEFWSCALCII